MKQENKRIAMTTDDLIRYSEIANKEMKLLQLIPRADRNDSGCSHCEVDEYGNIFWSSMVIGGKMVV